MESERNKPFVENTFCDHQTSRSLSFDILCIFLDFSSINLKSNLNIISSHYFRKINTNEVRKIKGQTISELIFEKKKSIETNKRGISK